MAQQLHWKSFLKAQTRNPRFLWQMVSGILALGIACAVVIQFLPIRASNAPDLVLIPSTSTAGDPIDSISMFESILADSEIEFSGILDVLPGLWDLLGAEKANDGTLDRVRNLLVSSDHFDISQRQIALGLWESLGQEFPVSGLVQSATAEPPVRWANWALGVFWHSREDLDDAASAYEREGRFEDAIAARRKAVELYLANEDLAALERLNRDPRYTKILDQQIALELAIARRDWWAVWWILPQTELDLTSWGTCIIAALTGLFWILFSFQAGLGLSPRQARFWIYLSGVGLGVLSIWPTTFAVIYQDTVWQLEEGTTLASGLRFYILGVGLREELCKLLFVIPLAPWLVRRRDDLEMLITSACVGLGFAAFENIQYFGASFSTSSIPRYLTANFFHMAATGIGGLWLCRAIRLPRECGSHFLAIFGIIVFAHGLYDSFFAVPALVQYSLGSMIIYILLCYQFFHELRHHRKSAPETISLTANFLAGVSLLTSISLVYVTAILGLRLALITCLGPALSTGLMVYMFLREMPESMVQV
ncbi:MAG: PrsW family intramembrane metalloprotease [Pirellulales bacterium]|nr:PrsW family intramembrane metalloprotease [Pirellulales bacterium]